MCAEKRIDYIKMPTLQEGLNIMQRFENIAGFKKVIGAVDYTHIKIPKIPGPNGQYYINRKGYSSLNVQVVCDNTLKIRNIVVHWRGSSYDSRFFNESTFEEGEFHGMLLGLRLCLYSIFVHTWSESI